MPGGTLRGVGRWLSRAASKADRPLDDIRMQLRRLQLLGVPFFDLGSGERPLGASRPMQLLAHLAVRGAWQGRDDLARLFWPERESKLARSNLRNLLHKTMSAAPFAPVECTEHALRLTVPSDLDEMAALVQRGDWEAAVRLGAAELLQGFEVQATEPYLRWLQAEREAALAQWKKGVQALLAQPSRAVDARQALADEWGRRCPVDEDAVQARVALAHERHQAATAARIYRDFEARLLAEFGVRPSRELERAALMAPRSISVPGAQAATGNAPTATADGPQPAKLFGRRLELQQLGALLADLSVRMITLTGPGGAGKSMLMAALYEQSVASGQAAACLVDASAAGSAPAAIGAIAVALRVDGLQGDTPEAALAADIGHRPCLLFIDGAEQPGLAAPLAALLDRCPRLRLVVAARRRLQLDVERVLPIDGFPLPDRDETDPEVLQNNDACAYFVTTVRRTGQPLDMKRDALTVAALVRAVDGLPLALRLLARLTHLFSLQQLLESVQQHVAGQVVSDVPELSELLPALVASFQRSWAALSPAEQAALANLAVFALPFDVAAARAVAMTSLPVITSLIDASLLRSAGGGRLSLHAAIRACVQAMHPPPGSVHLDYLEHYRQRLATLAGLARAKTMRPLRQFVREDAAHVERAWRLAVERRAFATVSSLAESLWFLHDGIGGWVNLDVLYRDAAGTLLGDPAAPPKLRALLLAGVSRTAYFQGRIDVALPQAREAWRLAQRVAHPEASLHALDTLVRACVVERKLGEADDWMGKVMALYRQSGEDRFFALSVLRLQRVMSYARSDFSTALRIADEAMRLHESFEDWDNVVTALLSRACDRAELDDLPGAIESMEEMATVAALRKASPALAVVGLCDAAGWQIDRGEIEAAGRYIARAEALAFGGPQSRFVRMKICMAKAQLCVESRAIDEAIPPLIELLETLGSGEEIPMAENLFLLAAKCFLQADDRDAALDVLRAIGPQPWEMRAYAAAQKLLRELGATAPSLTDAAAALPTAAELMHAASSAARRLLRHQARRRREAPR